MEQRADHLSALTKLLHRERTLVDELRDSLARQRSAIANDDPAALEASVRDVGRIVFGLEFMRRRRATMVGAIAGDRGFPLARFEERVAGPLPEEFVRVRADLREAGEGAANDVIMNHAVLRQAVEAGEPTLQRLFAPTGDRPVIDGAGE
jgi:flagellar FlgN protein